jgi:hypothetical protein
VAFSQAKTASVEEIAAVVRKYPQQIRSARIEAIVKSRLTPDFDKAMGASPNGRHEPVLHMTWAFKGEKKFQHYTAKLDATKQKPPQKIKYVRTTQIFDGKKQYELITSGQTGIEGNRVQGDISPIDRVDIFPLRFGPQVEDTWLVNTLSNPRFKLVGTTSDARSGTLYQFAGDWDAGIRTRFWLASKYGFLATRIEEEIDNKGQKRFLTHEMESATQRGSIWFPSAGTMQFFEVKDGKKILLMEKRFTMTRLELNNVPDSLFDPKLRPGYYMKDAATNEFWKIGTNGEKVFIDISNPNHNDKMPIGWLFMASLTSLLFLSMGALWRRRAKPHS